jgi:hypothetical protein
LSLQHTERRPDLNVKVAPAKVAAMAVFVVVTMVGHIDLRGGRVVRSIVDVTMVVVNDLGLALDLDGVVLLSRFLFMSRI